MPHCSELGGEEPSKASLIRRVLILISAEITGATRPVHGKAKRVDLRGILGRRGVTLAAPAPNDLLITFKSTGGLDQPSAKRM
jgi:hypothetical protein